MTQRQDDDPILPLPSDTHPTSLSSLTPPPLPLSRASSSSTPSNPLDPAGAASTEDLPAYLRDDDDGLVLPPPQYDVERESEASGGGRTGAAQRSEVMRKGSVMFRPGRDLSGFSTHSPGLDTQASLDADTGKINIALNLKRQILDHLPFHVPARPASPPTPSTSASSDDTYRQGKGKGKARLGECPRLNIVIFIVGSRGDVQPYLSLALALIRLQAHRVRIATHPEFRDFVLSTAKRLDGQRGGPRADVALDGMLEFFDVGGDPRELMAYMVKNPGLLPGIDTIRSGDIGAKRRMTAQLLKGFYHSTFFPDSITGRPFATDAIISNPPAFAHVHVAQALGVPLVMSFTMPWTATTAFSHPLVNIRESNAEKGLSNYLSYAMADMLTWQGLGDVINAFRTKRLDLPPLNMVNGPGLLDLLKVPWTYCWSEGVLGLPKDWKARGNIDISGFYFLESDSSYTPSPELKDFLAAGEPPIYIGFGSVVVQDPVAMTETIFEGVKAAGVRAIVSAGWGGLGDGDAPEGVFVLRESVPHDWLFADGRVKAVCHHGGAGTTAIGLRNGLPTIIVPFFGDQQFWAETIHRAGAGPPPLPPKTLTAELLSSAIEFALSPSASDAAQKLGEIIRSEKGEERGVASFVRGLPVDDLRCDIDPSRTAVWWCEQYCLKLSGAVAAILDEAGILELRKLEPHRPMEYDPSRHLTNPFAGTAAGVFRVLSSAVGAVGELFYRPAHGMAGITWGIPKAMFSIVDDLAQGFDNVPRLLGSDTRSRGKINNVSSGIKEGGLGLFFGVLDAVTGFGTEPYVGFKREGLIGIPKGVGRSILNFGARSASGLLGVVVHPATGIHRGVRRALFRTPDDVLRNPRTQLGASDAAACSPEYRTSVQRRFRELKHRTYERKGEKEMAMRRWFLTGECVEAPASASGGRDEWARESEKAVHKRWQSDAGLVGLGVGPPVGGEGGMEHEYKERRRARWEEYRSKGLLDVSEKR